MRGNLARSSDIRADSFSTNPSRCSASLCMPLTSLAKAFAAASPFLNTSTMFCRLRKPNTLCAAPPSFVARSTISCASRSVALGAAAAARVNPSSAFSDSLGVPMYSTCVFSGGNPCEISSISSSSFIPASYRLSPLRNPKNSATACTNCCHTLPPLGALISLSSAPNSGLLRSSAANSCRLVAPYSPSICGSAALNSSFNRCVSGLFGFSISLASAA